MQATHSIQGEQEAQLQAGMQGGSTNTDALIKLY
jgi:hypothetical protein